MKPSFQIIVDQQQIASQRLSRDGIVRSEPELASYRRALKPVILADVTLPKLPLVRSVGSLNQAVLIGEIAQSPGQVLLFDIDSSTLTIGSVYTLEICPP